MMHPPGCLPGCKMQDSGCTHPATQIILYLVSCILYLDALASLGGGAHPVGELLRHARII